MLDIKHILAKFTVPEKLEFNNPRLEYEPRDLRDMICLRYVYDAESSYEKDVQIQVASTIYIDVDPVYANEILEGYTKAILVTVVHEMLEKLRFNGNLIIDPHSHQEEYAIIENAIKRALRKRKVRKLFKNHITI